MKRFSLNPEALRTPAGAASAAFTFAALIALLWGVWRFIDWGVINAVFSLITKRATRLTVPAGDSSLKSGG